MLLALAADLLLQVLDHAGPRPSAVFAGCCRAARCFIVDHDAAVFRPPTIAQPFISSPLPPPASEAEAAARNAVAAEAFKACLRLGSWRDVWETTTRLIRLPCLGFFHRLQEGPFADDPLGGLT